MALKEAWKRCPRVHTVFWLICFTFMIYGNLSDPMARSLVECDTPLNSSEFSGSSQCGDRLLVIERGQELAAANKAVRLAVTVASCTALGVMADTRGRKAFLLTYLFAMLASVACVGFTASAGRTLAWLGYMVSGGLAGLFSIDQNGYRLILADIAEADKSRSELGDLYQLQAFVQAIASAAGLGLSVAVTSLHFTNYTPVCLPLAGLIIGCISLVMSMAETKPESSQKAEHQSVVATFRETVTLLKDNVYLRRKLPIMLVGGVVESFGPILGPFTMAVYGWEQEAAGKLIVVGAPIFLVSLAVSLPIARRVGERRAVSFCLWIGILILPTLLVLLPLSPVLLHVTHGLLIVNQTLPRCLLSAVDMQLTDEDIRARFQSLLSVCKMCIGMIMQPIVAWLFDATAKDYLTQARPMIFLAIFVFAINWMQVFPPVGPMYMESLDKMTEERLAKAEAAESKKDS